MGLGQQQACSHTHHPATPLVKVLVLVMFGTLALAILDLATEVSSLHLVQLQTSSVGSLLRPSLELVQVSRRIWGKAQCGLLWDVLQRSLAAE